MILAVGALVGFMVIASVDVWSGFYGPESEHLVHATFAHARGPSWKFVVIAAGFLLYAVDFYERAIAVSERR